MKKEISPVVAVIVVVVVLAAAAVLIWKGTQKQVHLPDKPPSGPIVLPPSQQGRTLPGGRMSAPAAAPGATGR